MNGGALIRRFWAAPQLLRYTAVIRPVTSHPAALVTLLLVLLAHFVVSFLLHMQILGRLKTRPSRTLGRAGLAYTFGGLEQSIRSWTVPAVWHHQLSWLAALKDLARHCGSRGSCVCGTLKTSECYDDRRLGVGTGHKCDSAREPLVGGLAIVGRYRYIPQK